MDAINTPTYLRLREQVRGDIVAGVWPLGSHVTLAQLAAHYGVSAAPVREALLQLQGESVVDMRMHRGALIPAVDERYIVNVYQVRAALQAMLAATVAERATAADVRRLEALCEAHAAAAAGGAVEACVHANRAFHHAMDTLADNPVALEVLDSRATLVDAFRRARGYGAGRLESVVAQHRRMVRAVARRDADQAARAAREHCETARDDLLALVRRESRAPKRSRP